VVRNGFSLDLATFQEQAGALNRKFTSADPFPHVVADGLFPEGVLAEVLAEFPEPERADWQQFDRATEVKLALADVTQMGPSTRALLADLNSGPFIEFLETLTGIEGLIPDPHYVGGGLHQIRPGGFLKVHADFNRHKRLQLDRRLNLLLYLNRDWEDDYGGHLELWDRSMSRCAQRVLPVFNRMVVFATTDFSFHGHPEPLTCPPDRARRSLALYYYTNGRPAEEVTSGHTTLFKSRPDENLRSGPALRQRLQRWVPPAVTDIVQQRATRASSQ
jgi:2OG-Fe(II) oxygenase superfamily